MERILKNTPFGYKTAKELYEKLVLVKFKKLKDSIDINDYYDFIFSAGALRDWIKTEQNLSDSDMERLFYNNKYMSIFQSIYNNSKHFVFGVKTRTQEENINYYVELDGELVKSKIIDEKPYLCNDTLLEDDKYLVGEVAGEYGELYLFCRIKDRNDNTENIFLYEICKNVLNSYGEIMSTYYPA